MLFASSNDFIGSCRSPFGVSDSTSTRLLKRGVTSAQDPRFYTTRVLACDSLTAPNRLMTYNAATKQWSGLCKRYSDASGSAFYKPVGQLQVNADNVRVAVFAYLNDNDYNRYGGVMRAPLKYLGPRHFDSNFNLQTSANPYAEWNATTGVFIINPQMGHAEYGDQGYGQSGAIQYINRFGTLDPDRLGSYKDYDPLSELYHEAFRYLQGKQPTVNALTGLTGDRTADRVLAENFPVYRTWRDPFTGLLDNPGQGRSCARNSILAIADPFTHRDRYLPGNTVQYADDSPRPAGTDPALDVEFWTRIVGAFEANTGLKYTGSDGKEHEALNIPGNSPYRTDLENVATGVMDATGATGSFLMAGLAYFANTHSFRTDLPKARITTYTIDVNSYNKSVEAGQAARQGYQLHLAAKYGGFDDINGTGNPFEGDSNAAWQGADGDARNYFLASDPQKFLDSISHVFASLVHETGSIAGVATTQRLDPTDAASVFQGTFNPVANYWSGRVRKIPAPSNQSSTSSTTTTASAWEAAERLTARTTTVHNDARLNHGADRLIVVGPPVGQQSTQAPTELKWSVLADAHKTALNRTVTGATDSLGEDRLNYIRGDRRKEQSRADPTLPFRSRDMVLGSIVNAGLVFHGAPSSVLTGEGYASFYSTNQNRTPVVFAAANDGMLHAFADNDGKELFAYMPGFAVPRVHALTDPDYSHRPILDATPTVGEARINDTWRSVIVGGAGGGAQGVYALDVTDPTRFGTDKVLWEFTDADHPALGNVIARPHIARVRVEDHGSETFSYKWVAIVPGGVNNHKPDGHAKENAAPSIFLLDLAATPSSPDTPWAEGVNFWRIELPQASTTMATGVAEITTVRLSGEGTLASIYTGDLQGNVWKLDFSRKGLSGLGTDALKNLEMLNAMGTNRDPMYVAMNAGGVRQPITSAPVAVSGVNGKRLVIVGTGKYLEVPDTSLPVVPGASLYVLPEGTSSISGRSALSAATISAANRTITTNNFTPNGSNGWYVDFDATLGERQTSAMRIDRGLLTVSTLFPSGGACGEGGGRRYDVDVLTGIGSFSESDVGLLGGTFDLSNVSVTVSKSDSSGGRAITYTLSTGTQGAKGISYSRDARTITMRGGRLAWREVNRITP